MGSGSIPARGACELNMVAPAREGRECPKQGPIAHQPRASQGLVLQLPDEGGSTTEKGRLACPFAAMHRCCCHMPAARQLDDGQGLVAPQCLSSKQALQVGSDKCFKFAKPLI